MDGVTLERLGETDVDFVLVNGKRVALVPRIDGAVMRALPQMGRLDANEVRAEVARIRAERGEHLLSDRVLSVPEPSAIRNHAAAKKRTVKT